MREGIGRKPLAVGVLGGCGQFLLFEAARFVPAAVMATMEYSALIWAFPCAGARRAVFRED